MRYPYVDLRKGDVIYANRGLYRHYGIYNNHRSVFHFSPDSGAEISPKNAYIRETSFAEFQKGDAVYVDKTIPVVFSPKEIIRRARRIAGQGCGHYDLIFLNCEHFAHWCATGKKRSKQVEDCFGILGSLVTTAIAVLGPEDKKRKNGNY